MWKQETTGETRTRSAFELSKTQKNRLKRSGPQSQSEVISSAAAGGGGRHGKGKREWGGSGVGEEDRTDSEQQERVGSGDGQTDNLSLSPGPKECWGFLTAEAF